MYHKLDMPRLNTPRKGLLVPAHLFEKQLRELSEAGWRSASLDDYLERGPQSNSVVITFDDGFESVWRNGMKPMAEFGFRAIQFLVPGCIGKFNHWDFADAPSGEKLMDDAQIRDWLAAGHEIGAHTMTHPFLTRLPLEKARAEIRDSKHALEDRFSVAIRHFAYPYGDWNPAVRDLVREAGFVSAVSTEYGVNSAVQDPWTLRRVASYFPLSERGNLFKVFIVRR
jgi:peptidoglycan/xylan/chitin deacetylase (PgdA/CDA1 family)